MASLQIHHIFFAASFVVLIAVSVSSLPPPGVHGVGDERGWTVPSASGDGTETLSQWATRRRFHVGDVLDFEHWDGSVHLVSHGDYEQCATASPARSRLAGGDTRFKLARHGLFYFISGVPARCEAGQRMVVRVVVRTSQISAPAPAPTPAPGPAMPPSDDDTKLAPSTLPFKILVSAALGFLVGVIFFGGLLWLLVYAFRA
ncbi:hypothetical protein ACP70R_006208 [Stipagrostis hirtigluma subsp. patula]